MLALHQQGRHGDCPYELFSTPSVNTYGEQGGLTPEDVAPLVQRVRIMVGDRDTTVSVAEGYEMYKAIRLGEMEVLPGTPHQLEKVSPSRLVYSLTEFFREG